MSIVTTKDGVEIFYKDWGAGQPIVFSHGWPLSADDWDAQMLFFLSQGYRVIAHDRRGHGRSTQTGGRPRHGPLCRRPRGADGASRSEERHPRRPFHRRRRGRPLSWPARRKPGGEGGDDQRRAAADGEDAGQSAGSSEGGFRRPAGAARRQPVAVLLRFASRAFLRLQPAGREDRRACGLELVAAGHDGRGQGALRRHRRLLADRLHRGLEEDQCAGAGHAQRGRSDRPLCRGRPAVRQAPEDTGR